jgi:hypothetical protein
LTLMGSNYELWVQEIPELPNREIIYAGQSRIKSYSISLSLPTAISPSNTVITRFSIWALVGAWITIGVPKIIPVLYYQRRYL